MGKRGGVCSFSASTTDYGRPATQVHAGPLEVTMVTPSAPTAAAARHVHGHLDVARTRDRGAERADRPLDRVRVALDRTAALDHDVGDDGEQHRDPDAEEE